MRLLILTIISGAVSIAVGAATVEALVWLSCEAGAVIRWVFL